jgi:hypothetical protein
MNVARSCGRTCHVHVKVIVTTVALTSNTEPSLELLRFTVGKKDYPHDEYT